MDKHTLRVLEFPKILQMIASYAYTEPGKALVLSLRPLLSEEEIQKRQSLIRELRIFLSQGESLGIEPFESMQGLFNMLRPDDATLEPLQLRKLLPLLYSALTIKQRIRETDLLNIKELSERLHSHKELIREIERAIAPDGSINDNASDELYYIRHSIRKLKDRIKRTLEGILNRRELRPHIQDFYITERNGRWVIPVKSDSKGHVKGVIHDISNTGETVFIEPREIQLLGDELESLRAEERLEEFRILKRLSQLIRSSLHEIESDYQIVTEFDMLQAAAVFSEVINATPAELNRSGYVRIVKGRHPLLWKTLKKQGRVDELVPLDFELGREFKGMVITGSNTGGKTVALKTVGVLTLMTLTGLHIPASSGTTIPLFKKVLADIGDEQSIEESLSTFSAHVARLSEIIKEASEDSLVIIDELGTGTDPDEGGALACAILRTLLQKGALVTVSTHLALLKAFAHTEELLINAAMEMVEVKEDGKTFYRPSYRLRIGQAGRSHALTIAERLGMPEEVINAAREFLTEGSDLIEGLISSLKDKESLLEEEIERARSLREELAILKQRLQQEVEQIKKRKQDTLREAYEEAREFLRKIKAQAYEHLEQLKRADRQRAKQQLKMLQKQAEKIEERLKVPEEGPEKPVKVGDEVLIKPLGLSGRLIELNEKTDRCKVLVKGREVETSKKELQPVEKDQEVEETSTNKTPEVSAEEPPARELNLIGWRVDPALSEVERFLNDASLGEAEEVRIIHGVGTGRLARAIRGYLKDHPLVQDFRAGRQSEGGEGVTIVRLR